MIVSADHQIRRIDASDGDDGAASMTRIKQIYRRLHWLVAAVSLALVCSPASSRAGDDPDKRRDLMARIDDKVDDLVDELERLPGDSSERPIDNAHALANEIKRLCDELEDVAGDDTDAKRIADQYPDDLDELFDVEDDLRALKRGQNHAQPEATQCQERERVLVRQAEEFEAKNDPDGLTELPKLAAQVQDETKRAIDEVHRDDDRLEDAKEEAEDYAADGGLREVDSAIGTAGRQMYAAGHKSEEAAEKACENLLKGVEHPEVKEALAKIGSSAGGRKAVMDQLRNDLRTLASTIASVSEDSGTGTLERAKSLVGELERGLDTLGRTATADRETKAMLEKWPEGVKQIKAALAALERLKVHQHELDALPDKCKQREQELDDAISKNGDDSDGIEEIPRLAEELAVPVRVGLDKARERLREEERDLAQARDVSVSEGPWSDVKTAQQRDAEETFRTFEDALKKTDSACEHVVKGKASPKAKNAEERLRQRAGSSGDQLDKDVLAWIDRARATYTLDCNGMKDMWQAYCREDWEPADDSPKDRAARTADGIKSRMRAAIDPVLADVEALEARVKTLADKRETKARGAELQKVLAKHKGRLTKLASNDVWRGNYDVVLQFSNTYGKQQHESLYGSKGCTVPTASTREAIFPSEGQAHFKPDCVNPNACQVWEFKPDSPTGHEDGIEQKDAYEYLVPLYYNKRRLANEPASDALGGSDIMTILKERCMSGGEIKLDVKVHEYSMCKSSYECVSGD